MPPFTSEYVWRVIMGNSLGLGSGEMGLGGGRRVTRTQPVFSRWPGWSEAKAKFINKSVTGSRTEGTEQEGLFN